MTGELVGRESKERTEPGQQKKKRESKRDVQVSVRGESGVG